MHRFDKRWERVYAKSRSQAFVHLKHMYPWGARYEAVAAFEGGLHGNEWLILVLNFEGRPSRPANVTEYFDTVNRR